MNTVKGSYAGSLRLELLERAEKFVKQYGLAASVYRSLGQPPTVLFRSFLSDGQLRHGNFQTESFTRIQCVPAWKQRLDKSHGQKTRALQPEHREAAKELDSCTSSDALLMNCFCHPASSTNEKLAGVFGFNRLPTPDFGFKANLPFGNGKTEPRSSEIDMRLRETATGRTVFIEAKLTEHDFTARDKSHVERYTDISSLFKRESLPSMASKYLHYQLLRNVLTAHHFNGWFVLICDQRRPDLQNAFVKVVEAVSLPELQSRCRLVTWQEIASILTSELKTFLGEKYGL